MTRLEIVLGAILLISIILNVGVFVYARAAIVRLLSVSEELGDLKQIIALNPPHISVNASFGSTRVEEAKVMEIKCDES